MKQTTTIIVSPKSVFFVIGTLLFLFIAWQIRGVLMALFVAYILMSGFAPMVDWLNDRGVNRAVSVALTYLVAISFFASLLFLVIPPLVRQTREFIFGLPAYVDDLSSLVDANGLPGITSQNVSDIIFSRINTVLSSSFSVLMNAFNVFLSFITVAVFSFYLLLERNKIRNNLHILFPHLPKEKVNSLAQKIEEKLGAWIRGELILMLSIGVATYVGLSLLRVEFALPLAVIAGLLEIVPVIGPILSAVPAMIIAFVQSPVLAVAVVALYILVQQLENNVLVPKIMERAVGLSPIVTIFALLVGGTFFGLIGAALAVPAAALIQVILEDYIEAAKAR